MQKKTHLQSITLKEEIVLSLFRSNKKTSFCPSKSLVGTSKNETFKECLSCMQNLCNICFNFCHKNCKEKQNDNLNENFVVYEFASSCNCSHKALKKEEEELHNENDDTCAIFDFFPKEFIKDTFSISFPIDLNELTSENYDADNIYLINEKNKKASTRNICLFCREVCFKNKPVRKIVFYKDLKDEKKSSFIKYIDKDYDIYKNKYRERLCNCPFQHTHGNFSSVIKFLLYQMEFSGLNFDLNQLIGFLMDLDQKNFHHQKSIFNLKENTTRIFKGNSLKSLIMMIIYGKIKATENQEIQLMEYSIKQLEYKNPIYLNFEKINTLLTFIHYFYNKYFFSNISNVNIKNINSMKEKVKADILKTNTEFRKEIAQKFVYRFFDITNIIKFMNIFISLRDYCIVLNKYKNNERNIPFNIYFLKLLAQSFSFDRDETRRLLEILFKMNYKQNQFEYNKSIRKNTDEIYYLFQITEIINSYESFYDNLQLNSAENYLKIFYFSLSTENNFRKYIEKLFSDEKHYLKHTIENLFKESINVELNEDEKKKILRSLLSNINNFINDHFYYFDCFHYRFFQNTHMINYIDSFIKKSEHKVLFGEKITTEVITNKNINSLIDDFNSENNKSCEILYFKDYRIITYFSNYDQGSAFEYFLNRIIELHKFKFKNNPREETKKYLFDYLFYHVKHLYHDKLYNSNRKDKKYPVPKNIEISSDFKEVLSFESNKLIIDLDIEISIYEEELKFILHKFFIMEYYKDDRFRRLRDKWIILLFILVSSEKNISFMFNKLNFLSYLLNKKVNEKKQTSSFLISSLINKYNFLEETQNFTWKFFYLTYKYFIDSDEKFVHLKPYILKHFIKDVLDYYKLKKINTNININGKLNASLVYFFLKIVKKMLLIGNFESCQPYNLNLNKFEIFEKINLIAESLFEQPEFDIKKYFNSINLFESNSTKSSREISQNKKEDNEIDEIVLNNNQTNNNLINTNITNINQCGGIIEMSILPRNKKFSTLSKEYILENLQYILIDLLGNFYASPNLNIYFKIINHNISNFNDYLKIAVNDPQRNHFFFKNKYFFKFELVILKFLFNFLIIKHYNFQNIDLVTDINLSQEELYSLGSQDGECKLNIEIEDKLISINSKYFIRNLREEIINVLIEYINQKKYEVNSSNENPNDRKMKLSENSYSIRKRNYLGLFLLNSLNLLLKNLQILRESSKITHDYEQVIFELFEIFFDRKSLMYFFENSILLSTNFDKREEKISEYYNYLEIQFSHIFQYLKEQSFFSLFDEKSSKFKRFYYLNPHFNGFNIQDMIDYIKEYTMYDDKPHSIYKRKIFNYIDLNSTIKKEFESYEENLIEYIKSEKDPKIKNRKEKLYRMKTEIIYSKWNAFYHDDIKNNNTDNIPNLMKYFFNHMKSLEGIEFMNIVPLMFSTFFSENFLKIVSYFNNFLYFNPERVKQYLSANLNKDDIKILLRNIIKLNNYIIGICEYENNEKFISLGKIYFILMDFFILLGEGIYDGHLEDIFFMELFDKESEEAKYKEEVKRKFHKTIVNQNFPVTPGKSNPLLREALAAELDLPSKKVILPRKLLSNNNLIESRIELNLNNNFIDIFEISNELDQPMDTKSLPFNMREKKPNLDIAEIPEMNDDFMIMREIPEVKAVFPKINTEENDSKIKENINNTEIKNILKNQMKNYLRTSTNNSKIDLRMFENNLFDNENLSLLRDNIYDLEDMRRPEIEISAKQRDYEQSKRKPEENIDNHEPHNHEIRNQKNVDLIKEISCIKNILEKINDKTEYTKEKDDINLENNFYYYNFSQLRNILNLFDMCYDKNFRHGSYRLIVQFLYISRYLKEFCELDKTESNMKNKTIIDHCFKKFFNFSWIFEGNIKNKEFSFIIRAEILNLLISYLDERGNQIDIEFSNAIYKSVNYMKIYKEIIHCFDKMGTKAKFKYEEIFQTYIYDDKNYKSKYCELAELYYKLLRYLEPLYLKLKDDYKKIEVGFSIDKYFLIENVNSNNLRAPSFHKGHTMLNKEEKDEKFLINNKNFYKFLMTIGKEIEVKFKESAEEYNYKKIYFFKSPKCFWMNKTFKQKFVNKVPRSSLGAKLDYLTKKLDKLVYSINLSFGYRPKNLIIGQFYKNFSFYFFELFNYLLILTINILLLINFTRKPKRDLDVEDILSQKISFMKIILN